MTRREHLTIRTMAVSFVAIIAAAQFSGVTIQDLRPRAPMMWVAKQLPGVFP